MTAEVQTFLDTWTQDPIGVKPLFCALQDLVTTEGITLSFTARPRISYSLRAKGNAQSSRDLFMVLDVIDDDPDARWISLCFYDDMVTDPEELGDGVPAGLFGEDARCFSIDSSDPHLADYVKDRVREAMDAALHGSSRVRCD